MRSDYYSKICDYDCFNCKFRDCVNDSRPVAKEKELLKRGLNMRGGHKKKKA